MPTVTAAAGLLLVIVGLVGYMASDAPNPVTALIPAFLGIALLICGGIAAAAPQLRKHLMHAAAGLGLLGFLAGLGRLGMVLAQGTGSALSRLCVAAMAFVCAVFLWLCVRSFIAARRAREATVER